MELTLKTGDATASSHPDRVFRVAASQGEDGVSFALDDATARVRVADWPRLIDQVRSGDLGRRHFEGLLPGVLGGDGIPGVLTRITSTPSYQLFLAGLDLAELLGLVPVPREDYSFQMFTGWNGRVPSVRGNGGVVLLPPVLLERSPPDVIRQLVVNNKLCEAALSSQARSATRHYVPYATPLRFLVDPVTKPAEVLWGTIRDYFYDNRLSA